MGNINFIYIPILIKNKNKTNLPCAYINVINYKTILKIVQKFEQLKNLNEVQSNKDLSNVEPKLICAKCYEIKKRLK